MELVLGQEYNRRELHQFYGEGSRMGGIAVMKSSKQIFIFSSDKWKGHYGYEDGWDADNYYHYTGAGQEGDQDIESPRHNGHILRHQENEYSIRLMTETRSGHHKYEADLSLVDYEFFETHDIHGKNRSAVRFIFEPEKLGNKQTDSQQSPAPTLHKKPDRTSRRGLVTSRVGQGYYRQTILNRFNRVCAVTSVGPEEILIASHIVPWRDSNDDERLDADNGILLSPTYDALFDKHLISFADDGLIMIGATLSKKQCEKLHIIGTETIPITEGMKPYLARHRAELR